MSTNPNRKKPINWEEVNLPFLSPAEFALLYFSTSKYKALGLKNKVQPQPEKA
jgi:hypothetical protein